MFVKTRIAFVVSLRSSSCPMNYLSQAPLHRILCDIFKNIVNTHTKWLYLLYFQQVTFKTSRQPFRPGNPPVWKRIRDTQCSYFGSRVSPALLHAQHLTIILREPKLTANENKPGEPKRVSESRPASAR